MQQSATRPAVRLPTTKKPAPRPRVHAEPRPRLKVASLEKWLDLCG